MFRRLFGAYLVILVVGLGGLAIATIGVTRGRMLDEIAMRLRSEAHTLRWAASSEAPDAAVKSVAAKTDTRLTIVAADGSVVADSAGTPARMDNHNGRPEVIDARARGEGRHVRFSETVGYDMMYVAVPLDRRDGTILRAALPLSSIDAELRRLTVFVAAAFGLTAVLAGAVGFFVVRGIVRPLRDMTGVAQSIAAGDFERRAPMDAPADLATLARALNAMSEELRRRMVALTSEAARIQAVLGAMQDGVIALGADGRVQLTNAAAARLLGFSGAGEGRDVWELARSDELMAAAKEALAGRPATAAFEREGRARVVAAEPVTSGGAVLVVRDVTEERRYEDLRKEFVANVSHELRTPLTFIRGFVETLRAGAIEDRAKADEFLATIEKHSLQLSALVEDLLELSKLDAKPELRRRRTRLDELLARVRESYRPAAEKKRIALAIESGPLEADVDPELVERAVGDLVDNAIKYTPEGGAVTIAARAPCVIEVRDTGIGIPEADQPRVFERFYRVDKSRSREAGGTGLGLAIVKHIAQLHGGSVTVTSRPGQGSTFRLEL